MTGFSTMLVANRGEIALRVARACRELGIRSVVAYSTADRDSAAVRFADAAVHIGPTPARRSYLNIAAVVEAALQSEADAVHPGYGFLSEDPYFAEICAENGLEFIGPAPHVTALLADKAAARTAMAAAGLPALPGSEGAVNSLAEVEEIVARIGFPVMLKAVAGGGGRGMCMVDDLGDLAHAYRDCRACAQAVFGDGRVYVERYLPGARHIEIQVLADRHGNAIHLGDRDCSVQRRHQKLLEEAPAPGLPDGLVDTLGAAAVRGTLAVGLTGVATFEFLLSPDGDAYFMEINARIQVEHPVTEMVTGIDLVREQILVASGARLTVRQEDVSVRGVSLECRVNAEDPARGFVPTAGTITDFAMPGGPFTRVDTHARAGWTVATDYDPLLAKVIVWAPDRDQAIARMGRALGECLVEGPGVRTTTGFLRDVLAHPMFRDAKHSTGLVEQMQTEAGR